MREKQEKQGKTTGPSPHGVTIQRCSTPGCASAYQDARYGGRRVHNNAKTGRRCTVCGRLAAGRSAV